jgi:hypothetical protein
MTIWSGCCRFWELVQSERLMTIGQGIQTLAYLAEKRGCITYEDFNGTFPDDLFSRDQIDEICIKLKVLGIEIIADAH